MRKDLLPSSISEFHKRDYWDSFFTKRKEAFEWYGDFKELKSHLEYFCDPTKKLLNLGCGNSELSFDMYDKGGYKSITNIDFSEIVIQQMISLNKNRTGNTYLVMDMLNMKFNDESFDVVLDKGALDAIYSENTEELSQKIDIMFKEIDRVLAIDGIYCCITLAQDHIASKLFYYFTKNLSYHVKISPFTISDSSLLHPFFIVFQKRPKENKENLILQLYKFDSPQLIIEEITSSDLALKVIKDIQFQRGIKHQLKQNKGKHLQFSLMSSDSSANANKAPRYILTIINIPKKKNINGQCACFIGILYAITCTNELVPRGREHEWLFATDEGREQLAEQANYGRLIVVMLGRDHEFKNMEEVQAELSPRVLDFAPDKSEKIPFLSTGEGLGSRKIIGEDISPISGNVIVEEIEESDKSGNRLIYRRLIFLQTINLVQTEVLLKEIKGGIESTEFFSIMQLELVLDPTYVSDYGQIMTTSLLLYLNPVIQKTNDLNILVLGLGAGSLVQYLHHIFPMVKLSAVELDPVVVNMGKKYFDLKESDRLSIVIDDAIHYIQNISKEKLKFDAIIIDIDSKDLSSGMSGPSADFVSDNSLKLMKSLLLDHGLLCINFVCRSVPLKQTTISGIKQVFPTVVEHSVSKDTVNKVLCAFPNTQVFQPTLQKSKEILNQLKSRLPLMSIDDFQESLIHLSFPQLQPNRAGKKKGRRK